MRVVVSNGFNRFHLAVAAAELERRRMLEVLVTGAYPTRPVGAVLGAMGIRRTRKATRLLDRRECVDDRRVMSLALPEAAGVAAAVLRHVPGGVPAAGVVDVAALAEYGRRAAHVLARVDADVYHFRAGFGHGSVDVARRRGMLTICDHSLVHPSRLAALVEHPSSRSAGPSPPPRDRFWRAVLADIERADHVLVNSDFVRATFLQEQWPSDRVHVAYLGVDDRFLAEIPPRGYDTSSPLRLIFAGFFGQRKGAQTVVEAFRSLAGDWWTLTIAGDVDPDLRRREAAFFADPRVRPIGLLSRRELAHELSRHDCLVFPSLAEGSARVVFEALACGCFPITTPNAGSIVEDRVHGFIVEPGSAAQLAEAVRRSAATRDFVAAAGRRNAALVAERYTQRAYGDVLVDLYERLGGAAPAAGLPTADGVPSGVSA